MSDSSSSDGEDDSRFRAACDPTLSAVFDNNITTKNEGGSLGQCKAKTTEAARVEDQEIQETRESFLLLNKIKMCLSSPKARDSVNGWKVGRERSTISTPGLRKRKSNTFSGIGAPSPLSAYLAKQLTGLLDQNVEIAATSESSSDSPAWKDETSTPSICLLKNYSFDKMTKQEVEGVLEKRRKVKQKKLCYFDSSDEDEVASKCHFLALSPQSILDRCDDYPWPHPKNIRYLENYQLKVRGANGSVFAVAINESRKSTVRTSTDFLSHKINEVLDCKMKGRHELKIDCDYTINNFEGKSDVQCIVHRSKNENRKKKIKKKQDLGSKMRVQVNIEEISPKAEAGRKKGTDTIIKKRKQSRKRGQRRKESEKSNTETNKQTSV